MRRRVDEGGDAAAARRRAGGGWPPSRALARSHGPAKSRCLSGERVLSNHSTLVPRWRTRTRSDDDAEGNTPPRRRAAAGRNDQETPALALLVDLGQAAAHARRRRDPAARRGDGFLGVVIPLRR